ncbi:hypothetical protein [Salinisphaera hydrothermalis]|uniref:Uncharacterized protein n=1 Tax=Salinisphaera hydrothermalis (strain C41B8) TaxID=1304275 RepID=A0A084INS2_SALHC|nr:hypothetical protein [Salinisphaera hydrothermalis]KEZ78356.1 hypothetical protein C41B8_05623 [Salinisphaera hydrothermalis C41B8]
MSIECGECERDIRGGHAETCSRYLDQCVGELHDVATTIQADYEGLETEQVKAIRESIRYLERMARGNVDRLANAAAGDLPEGYEITLTMERDSATIRGHGSGDWHCEPSPDSTLAGQVQDAMEMIAKHDAMQRQSAVPPRAFDAPAVFEIINPSDKCFFTAESLIDAAAVTLMLGSGKYGAEPLEANVPRVPMFIFGGHDEWAHEQFGMTVFGLFDHEQHHRLNELVQALRSVRYPEGYERSSMNNIVGRAHEIAEVVLKKYEDEK